MRELLGGMKGLLRRRHLCHFFGHRWKYHSYPRWDGVAISLKEFHYCSRCKSLDPPYYA